jgi:poly-gamma-glutamate synthesis protein (capsule biosynthesis protein)
MDFDIIPYKQCDGDPGVFHLDSAEDGHFRNEIERLNTIIADDDTLEAEFRRYVDSVTHKYDAYVEPDLSRFITALRRRRLFPRVMSQKKRLLLLNIVRCESHRDVLLRILRKYEQ